MTIKDKRFFRMIIVYAILCGIRYYEHILSVANSCLYILSYHHGFTSRGLIGSLWLGLNRIVPFDLITYEAEYLLCEFMTVLLFVMFLIFFYLCLKKIPESQKGLAKDLMMMMAIFIFPFFLTMENFGRIDIYLMMLTLLGMILLVCKRAEWLLIPICVVAMLIHQGYVFTNVNILLVLLLFLAISKSGGERKKYAILFIMVFVSVSVLFLYFEIFRSPMGQAVYNELVELNKRVSPDGNYYKELLQHEILGKDVYQMEEKFHVMNREELVFVMLVFAPYAILLVRLFKNLLSEISEKSEKLAYWLVILGPCTLIPEWLLKVDFGRYVFATIFYYFGILLCLLMLDTSRERIYEQLAETKQFICSKTAMPYMVMIFPAVLMPLRDIAVSQTLINILRIFGLQE